MPHNFIKWRATARTPFLNFQWVHKRPRYTVTKPKNRTGNSLFFLTTCRALDVSRQRWACASNTVDITVVSCADPGIFVMRGGGGGGGGGVGGSRLNWQRKNTLITFSKASAFYNFTEGSSNLFKENYNFLRFQWGSIIFQGEGGPNFSRGCGVQMLISIETYRICDFQVVRAPHTPLDPRMCMIDPLAISKFSSQQ